MAGETTTHTNPPTTERADTGHDLVAGLEDGALRLSGSLTLAGVARHWKRVRFLVANSSGPLVIDVSQLDSIQGSGAALVVDLALELERDGRGGDVRGATGPVQALLGLYAPDEAAPPPRAHELRESFLAQVGRRSIGVTTGVVDGIVFIGELTRACGRTILRPATFPFREWVVQLSRTGPDGVAIVALVNFLVGTILGFQSAVQLENYGAEIFVANLVGLSVVRELGPLMTAILLAGRSGAAFAAELGTMKVSEEVDALRTMGLSPHRFLVLPRVAALVVTMPLLTIIANAMGILGGLAIGCGAMGITLNAYWQQTASSIETSDVLTGLAKAVAFGGIVGVIACHRGLSTRGGAEGVGRSTTAAVVTVLFALIIADAIFTYLFTLFGL
jgi:phospholipid/cholesterol/gamma-HCH transport system permease protein